MRVLFFDELVQFGPAEVQGVAPPRVRIPMVSTHLGQREIEPKTSGFVHSKNPAKTAGPVAHPPVCRGS